MKIKALPIGKLNPARYNPRKDLKPGDPEYEALKCSIETFDVVEPIVWNKRSGNVVGGHQRLKILKQRGDQEIVVSEVDLDDRNEKALNIALNKIQGEWDDLKLGDLLSELNKEDFDLGITGFDESELRKLIDWNGHPGLTDEDAIPELPKKAITKSGDLWHLGEHRVLCGDSTKAADVDQLMEKKMADLCFTSPPYALGASCSLSGNTKMAKNGIAYLSYRDSSEQWLPLMEGFFQQAVRISLAAIINLQPLAGNKRDLFRWLADHTDRLCDVIVWNKSAAAPPMAEHVVTSQYEFLIVFGQPGSTRAIPFASWRGTVQSVYDGPPQRDTSFSDIHAATMPVHLALWVLSTLCDQAQVIYDPFLGSGTTLIAAEKLGRKCYGLEIEPIYCDVIVKRWENFTGKKAKLLKT